MDRGDVRACMQAVWIFFIFYYSLLSGRSFRSPRDVGWALAVEIWYLLFFWGLGGGFGGLWYM
jgi:hypothetical protein